MIRFWTDRDPREKILIAIALGLALLVLGIQFVLKPAAAYPGAQKLQFEQAERDLKTMKEGQVVLAGPAPVEKQQLNANQAQVMITQSASQNGLSITRRQPNGDTGLTVWLENADSRVFYGWISELTGEYNVELLSANLGRNDDGTVRAQLTFRLGI
jgi:general secretion pathway protein M